MTLADAPHAELAPDRLVRLARRLGLACMVFAVVSGLFHGLWELTTPIELNAQPFAAAPSVQRWSYGIMEAIKAVGFLGGVFGFFLVATRRGALLKLFITLAVFGALLYAFVWLAVAATGRDLLTQIGKLRIGSDAHSNGGPFFLWVAPVAVGIGALRAYRAPRWKVVWAIVLGLIDSQLFGHFPPGKALVGQGLAWLIFGYSVFTTATSGRG